VSEEPIFEEVKRDTGVDPDQLIFDRIVRNDYVNVLPGTVGEAYGSDMELTAVPIPGDRVLSAQDRCDRCGVRATTVASFGELELIFCNHHKAEQKDSLESKGWTVHASQE
jgi:hypothetical protein